VPCVVPRHPRILAFVIVTLAAAVAGVGSFFAPAVAGATPVATQGSAPAAAAAPAPAGDKTVLAFGSAGYFGSTEGKALAAPIVGTAPTPSGHGYWIVASDGGVFSYGDAAFHGSTGGIHLNRPVISMSATPSGHGYWMVASDGGVFSFGDAAFFGSTGSLRLNAPVIAMTPTPSGHGYWLLARDGGVFSFGDATFFGSTGSLHLNAPIVGMASTPTGAGYWLGARDGGIFSFGNAPFEGSGSGHVSSLDQVIQITGVTNGFGYRMLVAPLPFNTPLLGLGATGPAVVSLQQHLMALGYWIDGAGGSYGLTTQQAVYAFQKVEGLPRSGIVDIQTSERLATARRPVPRSTTGYVAEVDKEHQVIIIENNGVTVWVINTSTGSGIPYVLQGQQFTAQTPDGHFTVITAIDGPDVSPLGTLWRPRFFTGTGIAFHGSPSIPPFPASHGCVRMSNPAIDFIWAANVLPFGTAVWVY
jgi:peptidoglycan hydrolase-like protein with peptidoglycan-binding domain